MAKKKIDPAFKAAQQQNRLLAAAFPSRQKRTKLAKAAEEIRQSLPDYPAQHRDELGRKPKQSDIDDHVRSLFGDRGARADFAAISKVKRNPLKEYYKEILSEMGKVPTTPQQKKLAAHYGDKNRITRGDVITAAKKKQGLDEMALTKAAMKQELKKLKRLEDQDSRVLSRHTGRQVRKATDALSQLLRSKDLYDVDSKGGLTKVGELKGRRAAGELTGAAMFGMRGNRLDPATIPSAKELVKKHGMIYVGQDWDDEQLHPLDQTAAIGGKRGPTTAFLRPAKITKRYRD